MRAAVFVVLVASTPVFGAPGTELTAGVSIPTRDYFEPGPKLAVHQELPRSVVIGVEYSAWNDLDGAAFDRIAATVGVIASRAHGRLHGSLRAALGAELVLGEMGAARGQSVALATELAGTAAVDVGPISVGIAVGLPVRLHPEGGGGDGATGFVQYGTTISVDALAFARLTY